MPRTARKKRWVLGIGIPMWANNGRDVGVHNIRKLKDTPGLMPGKRCRLILEEL